MSTRQSSATSSEGVLEIGLPTNSEGGVAPGAKINVVETAPPINAVVGTYRAGLARTIRWVHRTVFLFNIPVWIGSDISELPVSASDRYLEDRWKVVRRSFSTLSRNSNICAAVISGLDASLLQTQSMSETPAAAVCIELAMLLSMAGLADGLALQYHVSGLRSASRARSWLDKVSLKDSVLNAPNILSTPPALTAWSIVWTIMGITLSKAGFLFHRGELDDPDTTKSSIPLIMHTIMVVFLLAHGMLFLRALRPTAFFSPPRPDIESGATIR